MQYVFFQKLSTTYRCGFLQFLLIGSSKLMYKVGMIYEASLCLYPSHIFLTNFIQNLHKYLSRVCCLLVLLETPNSKIFRAMTSELGLPRQQSCQVVQDVCVSHIFQNKTKYPPLMTRSQITCFQPPWVRKWGEGYKVVPSLPVLLSLLTFFTINYQKNLTNW